VVSETECIGEGGSLLGEKWKRLGLGRGGKKRSALNQPAPGPQWRAPFEERGKRRAKKRGGVAAIT